VLAVCATAHAGIIAYSINGGAFVNVGVGGTFNTNGDTGCGIAANCNEFSGFNINNAGGSGINLNGAVAFTTTDFLGNTLSALEQMTLTVDNTNVGGLPINVIVAVVSDTFDPSLGGPAGVGIFGTFLNDGGGGGGLVTADAQGEMDYYDTPAGGVPNGNSFALVTPLVGEVNGPPTPFWTFVTTPGSPANIESLVGFAGVDVGGNSVVSFPVSIEDNDTSFLQSETPEPGSYLLFGSGLAALGLAWRKRLGSLSQR
jgi:hypothetical protein